MSADTKQEVDPVSKLSYCTLFDSNYLSRGLALIESLREQGDKNEVAVLCLDTKSREVLENHAENLNIRLFTLEGIIGRFPELSAAQTNRKIVEFYFTLTPYLLKLSLLEKPEGHVSIYLDADLYFFGSPNKVITDIDGSSVAIIRHNYPKRLRHLEKKYGIFNVGLMAFRNTPAGQEILDWWAERCIEWCHDFPEDGKYADQGYLNYFFNFSEKPKVLSNPGFNLAPWNTASSSLKVGSGAILVDDTPLTFFHFHGFKIQGLTWVSSQLNYFSPLSGKVFGLIYGTYAAHLSEIERRKYMSFESASRVQRKGSGFRGWIANTARSAFGILSVLLGQAIKSKNIAKRWGN